ncbi:myb-binding protein 1A-like protein isoform X1 [Tetranychus urticae]|uniref:DNA polymerase V n=1 Tax=Tetranychus urticae TaxID=32264 RepID=T1KYL7_TETUR|nr:myb-binding protein 1A-like protein isoform X1 [Tetranychus urticae]
MSDHQINRPNYQVNQEILDLFPKLHCNDAKLRLSSANKILKIISKDKKNCDSHDFNYVVERLIKGTKSTKDASKIGSTILLTEILFSFPDFQIIKLFEIAKRILGDVNDLSLEGVTGWTLIFTAIVQSNRLDISEKKTLEQLVRFMVQLGVKKPKCNVAICNIFAKLFDSQFEPDSFGKILNSSLKFNEGGDTHPFHLYLILLINKHPELSLVLDRIPTVDLDSPDNLIDYVKATAVHLPLVHPACLELFLYLNENDKLEAFWGPVFNDTLFGLDHSNNGAYHRLGFSLLTSILPHLNESNAKLIFSKQMMDLWMQCLSNRSNRLHDVAISLSKELVEKYDDYSASLQESIITLLTESPGTVNFDDITHSNTVNQLYVKTKSEAVEVLVSRTIEKIKDYKALSARDRMRTLYVGQLRDLLKSSHLSESTEIKLNVLKFFLAHGYFDVSHVNSLKLCTPATEGLIDKIRILFFKIISSTCTSKLEILESIGLYVLRLQKAEVPLKDEKSLSLWKKVKKMKKQFLADKNEEKYSKQLSIFKPLLYGIAISSFQDKADLNALNSDFEELIECYKRSLGENTEEGEPEWPDVLLDMMISQFPSQSVFLSSIMIRVFRLIVSNITLEGVEQLKIALLADKLEDDDDEVGEGGEEEENIEKPGGTSDSDGDEEEDMDDEEPDDVDDEFRAKVTLALGPAAEIGDEFGATVDDEEMFQLDEALAEAFRSKYSKDKNIQATLKTLRARCLELVEIIFKSKDVSYEIILHLVPVLIDAIKLYNGPKDLELRNKVAKILTQLPVVKKLKSQQIIDSKILESILKKAVDLASKIDILTVQKCAARIYVWTMSIGKLIEKDIDCGFDNLTKLLADFFVKANSCVSKEFFLITFQNQQVHNSKLMETMCTHVFGNLRPFKKVGGLSLLSAYLKCFKNDIIQDAKSKSLLATIRKESATGLMSAVNAKKNLLTNEYLILLYVLSKITPLNLTPEEVEKIGSMNKSIRGNLTKAGKLARNRILPSMDKSDDEMNQSDDEENQSEVEDDEDDVANGQCNIVENHSETETKQNDTEIVKCIKEEEQKDKENNQNTIDENVNDVEENRSATESQQNDSKISKTDIDENVNDVEKSQSDSEETQTPSKKQKNNSAKSPAINQQNDTTKSPGKNQQNASEKTPDAKQKIDSTKSPALNQQNDSVKSPGKKQKNGSEKSPGKTQQDDSEISPVKKQKIAVEKSPAVNQQNDMKKIQSDIDQSQNDIKMDRNDCQENQTPPKSQQKDTKKRRSDIVESRSDILSNQNNIEPKETEKPASEAMDVDLKETKSDKSSKTMELSTPMRLTRSKAKRVKVKSEEEQSEADDEMPSFSVPRVAVVDTPLRRSLRNRKT